MALTRDFRRTIEARARRDPDFAVALLEEAANAFLDGEGEAVRTILRELVNATVGFEDLAAKTGKPSKSLHRMLSARGNPGMDNLSAIFAVLREHLRVEVQAKAVSIESRARRARRKAA